ncbi:pyridoxal-phosphate dependent enzyme [Sorangium sp. So ce375]|uniref:pyridoxal-phosphate dependent enzyme n=1 Tax=Sorangium sp. So ce375 TaxID=3133306 RepID=UPI003F5B4CC0
MMDHNGTSLTRDPEPYIANVPVGVLATIGNTPTIQLEQIGKGQRAKLYAKLEFLNPGGSLKDRPALAMLTSALAEGRIKPGGLIIESSSGNMGIGLAQAARFFRLRFICVIDIKTTISNIRILEALGAEVELIQEPHPETGEFLDARKFRVAQLLAQNPGAFWPNQYENQANVDSHCSSTAPELVASLGRPPDYVLVATSTCGTLGGFQKFLTGICAHTQIIAVDAEGSALFGPPAPGRSIPGLGSASKARLASVDSLLIDYVSTQDCVTGAHLLAQREAILVGGSSGGVIVSALRLARRVRVGASVAMILPDRGERYLDTIFNRQWLAVHCADLEKRMEEFDE